MMRSAFVFMGHMLQGCDYEHRLPWYRDFLLAKYDRIENGDYDSSAYEYSDEELVPKEEKSNETCDFDLNQSCPVPHIHRPGYGMKRREIPEWMEHRKIIFNIQKLKQDTTIRGTMGHHCIQKVLKPFFQDKMQKIKMENKVIVLMDKLHRMKNRFLSKLIVRRAKSELLNNQWELVLKNLQTRADNSNKFQKDCQTFVDKVRKIPIATRDYCL